MTTLPPTEVEVERRPLTPATDWSDSNTVELSILIAAHKRYLVKLEEEMATFDITVNPAGGLSARAFGRLPREAMDLIEIYACMKEFITTLQAEQFRRAMH